jgi:arylsulfatase A-like enzyme
VVSLDTLRADHLGCYGYPRPTSPFLDQLAQRATLFEEAYAQYPSTLLSHASMFTGLYPREHGMSTSESILPDAVETFPEVFQGHGFRTGGFTEGGYVSGRFGFRRGFDEFVARDRVDGREVERTFGRATRFLEKLGDGDRFLLFVHTYAVHAPYDAPDRYQRMFWDDEPPGAFFPGAKALSELDAREAQLAPEVVDWLKARYDAGIREVDDVLRRLFADLERLGLAADTTVVITSDHGEEFLEHGRLQHSQLYREVLRVPLLVVHPAQREGLRQSAVVELADLAPTLYALAGLTPRDQPTGVSFASLVGQPAAAGEGIARADGPNGAQASYRGGDANVESLLFFAPPVETWVARSLAFDAPPGELTFEARSNGPARRLAVRAGEAPVVDLPLGPDWTAVRIPAAGGVRRVRLEVDGCDPQPEANREYRCHGFQIRGFQPRRVELYDLGADPGQNRDLSRAHPRLARELLRDLLAFRPRARAAAAQAPLDEEALESLRALGYVQ